MRLPSSESTEIPKRPYRDSAILYGILAAVIVVVAWLTGGGIARAAAFAVLFFLAATAWSFYRWHQRIRARERDIQRRGEWRAEQEQRPPRGGTS